MYLSAHKFGTSEESLITSQSGLKKWFTLKLTLHWQECRKVADSLEYKKTILTKVTPKYNELRSSNV